MSSHQEELDLLLSLDERVLETPPGSPSNLRTSASQGYLSDDGSPSRKEKVDMSAFRDVVQDCLDYEPKPVEKVGKSSRLKNSNDPELEKFSGLLIRKQVVTPTELNQRFSDIRFVRLSTIKNLLVGDTLSGCWATVGVLTETGTPKTSSIGQHYSIWKFGCLDEKMVSVFLFGDAYQQNSKEQAGTVFALFNCNVRKDPKGSDFSLSVSSPSQILKMGLSVDYGVCKGKRKDGMVCTAVINKRQGIYCRFHKSKASERFSTTRAELKGGNLRRTAFDYHLKSEGIYLVDPLADKTNIRKPKQPVKLLSVDGLREALSNADKVTTNAHSQGIRFLNEMTGKMGPNGASKEAMMPSRQFTSSEKRKSSTAKLDPSVAMNQRADTKRKKTEQGQQKSSQATGKMIELEMVSSDDEF